MTRAERVMLLLWSAVAGTGSVSLRAQEPAPPPPPAPTTTQSPAQLQQLAAPIALYPDALVAQILAASTYPVQIVEAERWMQQHTDLPADQVAAAADSASWDPSVKALTQFPSVLTMLDRNLSWTSALGDAYVSQPQDVMDAVQVLRRQARENGRLASSPEETVTNDGDVIAIAPANPDIVYVPAYDPCTVYGWPIAVYPRWECYGPPGIVFGAGFRVGWWPSAWGWGWRSWGFDWHRRVLEYDHGPWVTRTNAFYGRVGRGPGVGYRPLPGRGVPDNRGWGAPDDRGRAVAGYRGGQAVPGDRGRGVPDARGYRPEVYSRPQVRPQSGPVDRGYGQSRAHAGTHSGAFTGFSPGGNTHGAAQRGRASTGGGGGGGGHGGQGGGERRH
jgi:hypothetical protein